MLRQAVSPYVYSIRGTLAPATLEAARVVHNQAAGDPHGKATVRSLGDLSHHVFVPMDRAANGAGELLLLDRWNSLPGLNQFLADQHRRQTGSMLFSQRDPGVWAPAEGLLRYYVPAPHGKNDQFVALVRGVVSSQAAAETIHNEIVGTNVNKARVAGHLSHEAYFRVVQPGSPESREFFAIDVWWDLEGMRRFYADPAFRHAFEALFTAEPATSVWVHPAGEWFEW
jgi:hypothetical protein